MFKKLTESQIQIIMLALQALEHGRTDLREQIFQIREVLKIE